MFLYSKGRNAHFTVIAQNHYTGLQRVKKKLTSGVTEYYAASIFQRAKTHSMGKGISANFFKDLIANNFEMLERIIIGDCDELLNIIKEFQTNLSKKRYPTLWRKNKRKKIVLTGFGRLVSNVFDYDTFVDKDTKWNAYDLTGELDVKVCVYCNRNYTLTLTSPSLLVRPELDHFLPRSIYPYLALSFYNLIPSCHTCNSNLKHRRNFSHRNNIHPYVQSLDELVRFSIKLKAKTDKSLKDAKKSFGLNFFYGDPDSFKIIMKPRRADLTISKTGNFDSSHLRRVLNNLDTFKILDLYNHHKDLVVEMIQASIEYTDDYIDELFSRYQGTLFRSREDVKQLVTRNYFLDDQVNNRPFSKLTRDMFDELGLN